MEKNKKIKNWILILITTIILIFIGLIIYDRLTVNNTYKIDEKKINIPIFVYHNIVSSEQEIEYDYMQTTKDVFEKQIKGLKELGYHFITYEELEKYKNNELGLSKRSCLLVFDDGFKGVFENAYPIAKKYNIPFTMFIITQNMDTEGVITWEQAREMKNSGLVTIGSHSVDHPDFRNLTVEEAVNNVNTSYEIIEKELGKQSQKLFTYPFGLYNEEQIEELEKQGYIQNLTDNKINDSKVLDLSRLHRVYPLGDSWYKIYLKTIYRSIKYN